MSDAISAALGLVPADEGFTAGDIARGLGSAAAAIEAPIPAPKPIDFNAAAAEVLAVYAQARAGGKDWYRSRGMWGSLSALVAGVALPACLVLHAPAWAYLVVSGLAAFGGAVSGVGRAGATGPIR